MRHKGVNKSVSRNKLESSSKSKDGVSDNVYYVNGVESIPLDVAIKTQVLNYSGTFTKEDYDKIMNKFNVKSVSQCVESALKKS